MIQTVPSLIHKMCDKSASDAYRYADQLAAIGSEEALEALVQVLNSDDKDDAYLAARALSKMPNNQPALEPLLQVIHSKSNQHHNGTLVQMLGGFDLSERFVDLFRLFLFGNFKASALSKELLDTVEFDISSRVLKKAEKHWNHFLNNTSAESDTYIQRHDDALEMIEEIRELLKTN